MALDVKCACGAQYAVRDDHAGRGIRCDACQAILRVPEISSGALPVRRFSITRHYLSWSEIYDVTDEEDQALFQAIRSRKALQRAGIRFAISLVLFPLYFILFAFFFMKASSQEQLIHLVIVSGILSSLASVGLFSLLQPKRHLRFHAPDGRFAFWILQANRLRIPALSFIMADAQGRVLVRFIRPFVASLLRRQWHVTDPEGRIVFWVREDSARASFARRVLARGFFSLAIRTCFVFVDPGSQKILGRLKRRPDVVDQYDVDLGEDEAGILDVRIALAFAALFSSVEGR